MRLQQRTNHFRIFSGLYKVVISSNPLSYVPDETFLGLERSLWELDLSHNQLTRVPNRALRYLRKLRRLDLKGDALSACGTFNCAF
jgi:Leucine-rich repeat (LRR) protein